MSKHKPIPKKIREAVFEKFGHHCAYCGCLLEYNDMQVDHIDSVYLNNDIHKEKSLDELNDIDNLWPSCRMCNFYKGTGSIEDFRNRLSDELVRNMRKPFDYRLALKYGLIKENIRPILFFWETYGNY